MTEINHSILHQPCAKIRLQQKPHKIYDTRLQETRKHIKCTPNKEAGSQQYSAQKQQVALTTPYPSKQKNLCHMPVRDISRAKTVMFSTRVAVWEGLKSWKRCGSAATSTQVMAGCSSLGIHTSFVPQVTAHCEPTSAATGCLPQKPHGNHHNAVCTMSATSSTLSTTTDAYLRFMVLPKFLWQRWTATWCRFQDNHTAFIVPFDLTHTWRFNTLHFTFSQRAWFSTSIAHFSHFWSTLQILPATTQIGGRHSCRSGKMQH